MKDIRSIRPRLQDKREEQNKEKDFDFCNFNFCVFFNWFFFFIYFWKNFWILKMPGIRVLWHITHRILIFFKV